MVRYFISTSVRPVALAKLIILGILCLNSFVLAPRAVVEAKLITLHIVFNPVYFSIKSSVSS